jgi:sterol desaturase/sphingolipid hydroxylase (fatty acid hydroxylase superfamily)
MMMEARLEDMSTWSSVQVFAWTATIAAVMELMNPVIHVLMALCGIKDQIPVKGKHLDALELQDYVMILTNKLITGMFVYHCVRFVMLSDRVAWGVENLTVWNTVVALPCLYLLYDLIYYWFHRMLHLRSIYRFIHKHHHRQMAPSRGNHDAINVHPFEFGVGEYLHLFCFYVIPCHVSTIAAFIILGGIIASLNHTRYDFDIGLFYSVRAHDMHHHIVTTNYAQYIMFWDRVFGSFRENKKENDKNSSSAAGGKIHKA